MLYTLTFQNSLLLLRVIHNLKKECCKLKANSVKGNSKLGEGYPIKMNEILDIHT